MDLHSCYTVILSPSANMVLVNQLMFVTPSLESVYAFQALDKAKVKLDADDPLALDHVFLLVTFKCCISLTAAKRLIEQVPLNYVTVYHTTNPRDNGYAHRRIYRAKRVFDGIHIDDPFPGMKAPIKYLEW